MTNPIQELKQKLDSIELWQDNIWLNRNEYLTTKGSHDSNLYFVLNGSLRVFIVDEDQEQNIRFGYEGSFIAALDSFITGNPTEFYIQAIKKTELKVIAKKDYIQFMHSNKENMLLWNRLLEMFILQQMERETDLLISSPIERYKRVLKRSPALFQEIPNKYIANYLRMTPETLSRIKKY